MSLLQLSPLRNLVLFQENMKKKIKRVQVSHCVRLNKVAVLGNLSKKLMIQIWWSTEKKPQHSDWELTPSLFQTWQVVFNPTLLNATVRSYKLGSSEVQKRLMYVIPSCTHTNTCLYNITLTRSEPVFPPRNCHYLYFRGFPETRSENVHITLRLDQLN